MTLATTVAKAVTVIDGTDGVENVYSAPLTEVVRSDAEDARGVAPGTYAQSWEVVAMPRVVHGGASGMLTTELDLEVIAHWRHADGALVAFRTVLASVMDRLADPSVGFPQLKPEGVLDLETPEMPVKLPTGQSAYRARFRLSLWNVVET